MLYISKFVSSFVMMSVTIYSWYRLMDKDISLHKKQNFISVFLLSIISIVNYYIINSKKFQ